MISQIRPILVPFFMTADDPMIVQKSEQLVCAARVLAISFVSASVIS
jgi:hypothetical protein